ncbi:MAG TPA: sigma-54-dependent Fis family transcriptional regulator [Thiotrichales bacterium]|nr:sigma-54-dependent Fis family transcriptional regulator [Thiotrichales bacterium]
MPESPDRPVELLFVDDDPVTCSVMQRNCDRAGYRCRVFDDAQACLNYFEQEGASIIVTDLRMPGMSGFDLLRRVRDLDPDVPVLVMTGYSTVENAVEAMKLGANDFLKKPFDFQELRLTIERNIEAQRLKRENLLLKRRLRGGGNRFGMIGDTPVMRTLFNTVEKVASVSCNVIISGESGTGKELVARALHDASPRAEAPFVVIDCGALTETLLESELFGHEKGAFTGATQRKRGLMEQAHGGTLFLDEISNISDGMQMKLMRAIEHQRITRVGSTVPIEIDLRIIAASNRDLEAMVRAGEFRHDFYHRLNVVNIRVPSLAERRDDIPALVEHFVEEFARRYDRRVTGFDSVSMRRLYEADWPGNVRELRNTVERCVILADGPLLSWQESEEPETPSATPGYFPSEDLIPLEKLEEAYIRHVLRRAGGKKSQAARILGIDKTTLWRKLRRYGERS